MPLRSRAAALTLLAFASSTLLIVGFSGCSSDPPGAAGDAATDTAVTTPDAAMPLDAATTPDAALPPDAQARDAALPDAATTGGPFSLVYSGKLNGIDSRIVTATLGPRGELRGYVAGANEAPVLLTATAEDIFSDSFASVGRWTNGTVGGPFYDDGGVKTLSATEAQHYGLALVPPTFPPSGTATYKLAGATKPNISDGSQPVGTVTSGALTATFGGTSGTFIGFDIGIQMNDGGFAIVGNGGSGAVGTQGTLFTAGDAGFYVSSPPIGVTTDAGACSTGTCTSTGARVTFAGPNLERIVVAFVFGPGTLAGARRGVVVFERQ